MSLRISGLPPITPIQPEAIAPAQEGNSSFGDVLSSAIRQVESARTDSTKSVERFLSGEGDDLHTTILATQRAELEFQMFLQVRNKVVAAYQDIMKMQM